MLRGGRRLVIHEKVKNQIQDGTLSAHRYCLCSKILYLLLFAGRYTFIGVERISTLARIFICYRRDDSEGYAGRLYDRLSSHFGVENVFMDIVIEPGEDFVEVIEHAISSCNILLAVIGKQWLTINDPAGRRRLDNRNDFVRLEIETALQRNIRVIPLLVQGALMPRLEDLPESLVKLSRRQALELSRGRWHVDVDQLIQVLEKTIGQLPTDQQLPQRPETPRRITSPQGSATSTKTPSTERTLPLVIFGDMVVMPHILTRLSITAGKSYRAMERAMEGDREVLLIFVSESEIEGYKGSEPQQLPQVGVIARLEEFLGQPDDTVRIILEGMERAEISGSVQNEPFYMARCTPRPDSEIKGLDIDPLISRVKSQLIEMITFMPEISHETIDLIQEIDRPGHLADFAAQSPAFDFEDQLELINMLDPLKRLLKVQAGLSQHLKRLRSKASSQNTGKDIVE